MSLACIYMQLLPNRGLERVDDQCGRGSLKWQNDVGSIAKGKAWKRGGLQRTSQSINSVPYQFGENLNLTDVFVNGRKYGYPN